MQPIECRAHTIELNARQLSLCRFPFLTVGFLCLFFPRDCVTNGSFCGRAAASAVERRYDRSMWARRHPGLAVCSDDSMSVHSMRSHVSVAGADRDEAEGGVAPTGLGGDEEAA